MSFKIRAAAPGRRRVVAGEIQQAIPGAVAKAFEDAQDALTDMADATRPRDGAARALRPRERLRWICAARAGPGRRVVL